MRKTVLLTGLALAIGLGALGTARAQGMGEGQGMMGEGMADMAERFEGADTDGDGLLSRDELTARMTERAAERIATRVGRMIEHHDADGDGQVSMAELESGPMGRMFEKLDADGNGAISPEEFARMREMRREMMDRHGGAMRGHHGKGGDGRGKGRQGEPGVVIHQHFCNG